MLLDGFSDRDSKKIDRYVGLVIDKESLVLSSKSIIRKRQSPLARKIAAGDVSAIIKAAKDRVYGSLSKEQRDRFCSILCDLKTRLKGSVKGAKRREIIAYAISSILGFISTVSGLLISLIWLIREEIGEFICKCKLDGACQNGNCQRHGYSI